MLSLHIESDEFVGCWVYIRTYFGTFHYFSVNDVEIELQNIVEACKPCENFKENFIKKLGISDIVKKLNTIN